jgi:hypothetical protein
VGAVDSIRSEITAFAKSMTSRLVPPVPAEYDRCHQGEHFKHCMSVWP